ncbi:undecaprenyl-phosphate glucose phosphotransferase [Gaetbulibacter aestuarii]
MWIISTAITNFYSDYRHILFINLLVKLLNQLFIFSIVVFAFLGFFREIQAPIGVTFKFLYLLFFTIGAIKISVFYILKSFRGYLKGNQRKVVVVGNGESIQEIKEIFLTDKELGYHLIGFFTDSKSNDSLGTIEDCFSFLESNNEVDEIYCGIDDLSEKNVNKFIQYANIKQCNIKFVPNTLKLFNKKLKTDYYKYVPILTIQEGVLNQEFNKIAKRVFDIIFSILVIVFILSWLSVILFIIIKLESKGPLFYRHKRTGIHYKEFYCYKFRSLKITKEIEGTYVKRDDDRTTRIGTFLRRTSIDELPQFFNVLRGDMSVVGPRPHMPSYTEEYSKKIDKYSFMYRHHVKPGITGLAQIKGYRGEIEEDKDIINRVKYDIFYIENWSILLDLKIMFQTFINALKGEEKAY